MMVIEQGIAKVLLPEQLELMESQAFDQAVEDTLRDAKHNLYASEGIYSAKGAVEMVFNHLKKSGGVYRLPDELDLLKAAVEFSIKGKKAAVSNGEIKVVEA